MRIEPANLPDSAWESDSRYPVEDVASRVDDPPLAKLRRVDGEAGPSGRLPLSPNPARANVDVIFSVPVRSRVTLTLYDIGGREVVRVIEPEMMDAGRYAIDVDAGRLAPGGYLVEMTYGDRRLATKLVVVR
jgi:hypothetical protein